MIHVRIPYLKILRFAMIAVALCVGNQANAGSGDTLADLELSPPAGYVGGQPLSPGALTLKDILRSKAAQNQQNALSLGTSSQALPSLLPAPPPPQIVSSPHQGTPGALLLEGMQNVLGVSGNQPASVLHAPNSADPVITQGKTTNVAAGISATALPDAVSPQKSSGGCTPKVSSWVKTCVEAGYPDTYVGQIHGETRSTCPEGSLQDVWISNGCVPPEGGHDASKSTDSSNEHLTETSENMNPANASCGQANGMALEKRPTHDLCMLGTPSMVSGDGPWRWNCQGLNGGMTVSCAASASVYDSNSETLQTSSQASVSKLKREDGECGSADKVTAESAPFINLCKKGIASSVNGNGPWAWACSGINGGKASACSAPKKVDGVCGSANGSGSAKMPMSNLCQAGYASAVTGSGPWNWTCSGLNGGQAATCSDIPKKTAVLIQNGTCGAAHGAVFVKKPEDGLCVSGKASQVVGAGPWNWTCEGSEGGNSSSCTASLSNEGLSNAAPVLRSAESLKPADGSSNQVDEKIKAVIPAVAEVESLCGSASELVASKAPTTNLCKRGKASSVTGADPWVWTCADKATKSSCSTLSLNSMVDETVTPEPTKPVVTNTPKPEEQEETDSTVAACGGAVDHALLEKPSGELCLVGKASVVKGNGPWTWECTKGKSNAACEAKLMINGVCGASNGASMKSAPVGELCKSGKPTATEGNGPWTWACEGTEGGSTSSCSSSISIDHAPAFVDGNCGPAGGTSLKTAPTSGLCSVGSPSAVQGKGPWMWTCAGTDGGISASCSAAVAPTQVRIDGSCGAASNSLNTTIPSVNLCDTGVPSSVYGNGPWTWTCSGANGGIAASCAAQKDTPPAPPPPGPTVNGLCGPSNGEALNSQPFEGLCSTGIKTPVSGNGPWNWNCIGENGGMTVSCTALLQPPAPITGVCGVANGVPTFTTPKSGLCSGGISSAVSGKGPWTWSCSGVNGGSAVGCVAPLAGTNTGSLPSMTTSASALVATAVPAQLLTAPETNVPKGLVTPRMSAAKLPPLDAANVPPPSPEPVMAAPPQVPQLSDDMIDMPPPPVRDTIKSSAALRSQLSDGVIPGNHFVLDDDLSSIAFEHGSENLEEDVMPSLSKLADTMTKNAGVRITLMAYADNKGMSARDARRISLGRALAIRDYLTSQGISSARIDVRALGANVPSGDGDRVDIKVN